MTDASGSYRCFLPVEQSSTSTQADWKKLYEEDFTKDEREIILSSLHEALAEAGYKVPRVWGEVIEDRGSQITFSAFGQQAPLEEKNKWDPDYAKRKKIKAILDT